MLCCEKPDTKLLQKRLPAFNKSTPKPIFGSLRGSVPSPEPENSSPVSPSHTCRGLSPPAGSCGHEGPGSIREAGPGPLPHRGKPSERAYRNFDCCGRQRLGFACRASCSCPRCRLAVRRLWSGRTGTRRCLSRLPRSFEPASPCRRGWGEERGLQLFQITRAEWAIFSQPSQWVIRYQNYN